jgi:hypothetical protein
MFSNTQRYLPVVNESEYPSSDRAFPLQFTLNISLDDYRIMPCRFDQPDYPFDESSKLEKNREPEDSDEHAS